MTHANAPLTPLGRLRLARYRIEQGATLRQTADRFQVSTTTVIRWCRRYQHLAASGVTPTAADMADRSSRPHRSPSRTHVRLERKIKHLRLRKRLGPVQIAGRVGVPASTVHAVLTRQGLNRLRYLDRATGEPIRRYEKDHPGELVHVDIKKLAVIPEGGGWRVHGRRTANRYTSERTNAAARQQRGRGQVGYGFIHSAVDDYSRLAYSEIHDDETSATAVAFWRRAQAFYANYGITVTAVMTDNGACYRSLLWRDELAAAHIKHRRTRPYRPQSVTNLPG